MRVGRKENKTMTPEQVLKAIQEALVFQSTFGEWNPARERTKTMLRRRTEPRKTVQVKEDWPEAHCVLDYVMAKLGFKGVGRNGGSRFHRVYGREWRRYDMLAVESDSSWDDDCWRGQYRNVLAVEVENNIQEFALTMRGLLDIRCEHLLGIFYAPPGIEELGDVQVGVARTQKSAKARSEPHRVSLLDWRPSFLPDDLKWMMAVFLDDAKATLRGACVYRPGADPVLLAPPNAG